MSDDAPLTLDDLAQDYRQEYLRTVGLESTGYMIASALVAIAQEIAKLRQPVIDDAAAKDSEAA